MQLYQVIWTRLYGNDSYADAGTLLQLKSLINRSNVRPTVKKDVNAAMDFLQVGKKVNGCRSLIKYYMIYR